MTNDVDAYNSVPELGNIEQVLVSGHHVGGQTLFRVLADLLSELE